MRKKPVNLDLFTISFPMTAIVSILHRISGLILFILIPCLLVLLQTVMHEAIQFSSLTKVLMWFGLSALFYHLIAGIRHIIMDLGYAESKIAARYSAYFILSLTIVFSLVLGLKLC